MDDAPTTVTILKYEAYNFRHGVQHPSWFRMEHSFFENPDFFEFNNAEKVAWLYLLCMACKKNSGTVGLSWPHIEKIGGIKRADFESALKKLEQKSIISTSCNMDVTSPLHACDTDVTSALPTGKTGKTGKTGARDTRPKVSKGAIPEFATHPLIEDRLKDVTQETQRGWIEHYQDVEWIRACLMDCVLHFQAKGEETKSWGLRFLNWLKSPYNKRPRVIANPQAQTHRWRT